MFTLDHFPVWYRRAAEYPAGQFLYYMPRQETRGRGHTFTEQISTHTGTQNTICTVLFPIFSAVFSRLSQKSLGDRLISLQPAGYNCSFLFTSLYIYVVCRFKFEKWLFVHSSVLNWYSFQFYSSLRFIYWEFGEE